MFAIRSDRSERDRALRYRSLAILLDGGFALDRALEQAGWTTGGAPGRPGARTDSLGERLLPRTDERTRGLAVERAAIDAAWKAGELPALLRQLADDLDAAAAARRVLLAGSAYPLLLLHLVPIAATASLWLKAPGMAAGTILAAYGALWGLLLAGHAAATAALRSPRWVARLAALPLLGPPVRLGARMRFFRLVATLDGAGVLRQEALALAAAALGAGAASGGYSAWSERVRAGEPTEAALEAMHDLDPIERSELASAALVGEFERAARRVAARATEGRERALKRLARVAASTLYAGAVVTVAVVLVRFYSGYLAQLTRR